MRVLVAEDNMVNRELARHLLVQLGHDVVLASDGNEVLARLEEQPCDLILMDLWMPQLDGLAACERIRASEKGTVRRTPIIALTAHAVKGDREACIAAGMDDYLVKPVRQPALAKAIERIFFTGVRPVPDAAPPERRAWLDPWEGVDSELLRKLAPLMLDSTTASLKALQGAHEARDWMKIEREAHTLKGSLGLFHVPRVVVTTKNLETAARLKDDTRASALLDDLAIELAAVQAEVRERCGMS